ncbi:hypothetical protein BJ085DRAFT_39746 [Dimargaris cristalligena]|uniref:Uncharacterized protein n=1 Tax=Dimargaris cristalligena TaxID=215637 RepID=A0A4Q0A4V4_9FUNG|nr:hypothetical protein BJ085DRAFT_39746 [Dimargaris cristalligena]|eukprot:RKP40280.1 hypothetical protein BJ085DRAFT_39746 [Dimargaris cristalligena]
MVDIAHFEVRFPAHAGPPKCKPGATIVGAVLLNCKQPIAVSSLLLSFKGEETVSVTVDDAPIQAEDSQAVAAPPFHRVYFHAQEQLLGAMEDVSHTVVDAGVRLFHFSCTMPPINFPVPAESSRASYFPCPAYEIKYTMEANLTLHSGEEIHTEPVTIHPEPIVWPAHLEPQLIGQPLTLREGAYDRNRLTYHLEASLNRSAYCPGDNMDITISIKPVAKNMLPHMGEVDLRERCECHLKPPLERTPADEPVWTRTKVVRRQPLEFTRISSGSAISYKSVMQLKIPDTACPVTGVHSEWTYTCNVTLFENQGGRMVQSIAIFPINMASGLPNLSSTSIGSEVSRTFPVTKSFPKHELQPIGISKVISEPGEALRHPVIRAIKEDTNRLPPVSPGLVQGSKPAMSFLNSSIATDGPPSGLIIRNVSPIEDTTTTENSAFQRQGVSQGTPSVFTIVRPRQYPATMSAEKIDARIKARAQRSARYKTCIIGASRTRSNMLEASRLLEVDVGESFENLIFHRGDDGQQGDDDFLNDELVGPFSPLSTFNGEDDNTDGEPHLTEDEKIKAYLKTLTFMQPKSDSFLGSPMESATPALTKKPSLRQRTFRHRTCVITPSGKYETEKPLRAQTELIQSPTGDNWWTLADLQANQGAYASSDRGLASQLSYDNATFVGAGSDYQMADEDPTGSPDPEGIRELQRELEDILLKPQVDPVNFTSSFAQTDGKKGDNKWEPSNPMPPNKTHLANMNLHMMTMAPMPTTVNIYKATDNVLETAYERDPTLFAPIWMPTDLDNKKKNKTIRNLTQFTEAPVPPPRPHAQLEMQPNSQPQGGQRPQWPAHTPYPGQQSPISNTQWEFVILEPLPFQDSRQPVKSCLQRYATTEGQPKKHVQFSNIIGIIDSELSCMSEFSPPKSVLAPGPEPRGQYPEDRTRVMHLAAQYQSLVQSQAQPTRPPSTPSPPPPPPAAPSSPAEAPEELHTFPTTPVPTEENPRVESTRLSEGFYSFYEGMDEDDFEDITSDDENMLSLSMAPPSDDQKRPMYAYPRETPLSPGHPTVDAPMTGEQDAYLFLRPNEVDNKANEVADMIQMYLTTPEMAVKKAKRLTADLASEYPEYRRF